MPPFHYPPGPWDYTADQVFSLKVRPWLVWKCGFWQSAIFFFSFKWCVLPPNLLVICSTRPTFTTVLHKQNVIFPKNLFATSQSRKIRRISMFQYFVQVSNMYPKRERYISKSGFYSFSHLPKWHHADCVGIFSLLEMANIKGQWALTVEHSYPVKDIESAWRCLTRQIWLNCTHPVQPALHLGFCRII